MARPKARQQDVSPVLLHPCRSIQRALGVCEHTVWWWAKKYGLPVFHLPDGQLATTVGMIETWAQERREEEMRKSPPRGDAIVQKHGQAKLRSKRGVKERMSMVA